PKYIMVKGLCVNCKKEKEIALSGKAKGLCKVCYKKLIWKPKLIECKRCKRMLPNQAFGFCKSCYLSVFHMDRMKEHSIKQHHNIDPKLWKEITKKCVVCGFDKIVDLHHLDHNHDNNSRENLIGLCPNHHRMIHNIKTRKEVLDILKENGYVPLEKYLDNEFYK
ncbi:MAG: HNH endonuclease signature motif containing protein, partial [archaeon]